MLITCGVLIMGLAVSSGQDSEEPPSSTTAAPQEQVVIPGTQLSKSVKPRVPTRLLLWHYDAQVIPLDLSGSALIPPSDPRVLGWWGRKAGAEQGTVLLTGHTVHSGGGTFDDLEDIPVGEIGSLSGVKYRVVRVEVISKSELAKRSERLFSQDGSPRLVLVTCEDYNAATGHYESNVVVVARPL